MKAIIEKEYIVDKVVGDIKCGDKVLQDCIGTDRTTLIIRFYPFLFTAKHRSLTKQEDECLTY